MCFPVLSIYLGFKTRLKYLNWSNFVNASRIVGLLQENDVLLAEVAENDFVVMTANQIWYEDFICTIVIATDIGNEKTANTLVQMSLSSDSEPRHPEELKKQVFYTEHKPYESIAFELGFSSEFDDTLCRADLTIWGV